MEADNQLEDLQKFPDHGEKAFVEDIKGLSNELVSQHHKHRQIKAERAPGYSRSGHEVYVLYTVIPVHLSSIPSVLNLRLAYNHSLNSYTIKAKASKQSVGSHLPEATKSPLLTVPNNMPPWTKKPRKLRRVTFCKHPVRRISCSAPLRSSPAIIITGLIPHAVCLSVRPSVCPSLKRQLRSVGTCRTDGGAVAAGKRRES